MTNHTEMEDAPFWLTEVLDLAVSADTVKERMRRAGRAAYSLTRLRKEVSSIGFLPLPFGSYLEQIAKLANVALEPVMDWAGVRDARHPSVETCARLGRLGHELGLSLEQMLLLLRTGFAENSMGGPLPLMAAHRGGGAVNVNSCDQMLRQVESTWPSGVRQELDALVGAVTAGYRESASRDLTEVD